MYDINKSSLRTAYPRRVLEIAKPFIECEPSDLQGCADIDVSDSRYNILVEAFLGLSNSGKPMQQYIAIFANLPANGPEESYANFTKRP